MEPVLDFLQHFWWVAFPVVFAMSGVGRAWERGARQRHKRRLEIIQAKSGLRATTAAPAQIETPASPTAEIERLASAHDAVTARWLEYELDVAKLIAFPAMSDGRQPLTAAFLRAKKVADRLRPDPGARVEPPERAAYRDAVTDYEVAFDLAERDARRIRDSEFTPAERKRLDTAQQLLSVAVDQAATPAERQLAYRRVRQELDGLISLSDDAVVRLEEQVALELTTGHLATANTASTAAPTTTTPTPATPPPAAEPRNTTAAPAPAREPRTGPWPVPARNSPQAPGRVIHPKPHP